MKIVRPTEVTVTFEDAAEAAKWLVGYLTPGSAQGLAFGFTYDTSTEAARRVLEVAEAEAIRVLAAQADLPVAGVTREADKEHAAPTYISGSSDRVYLISEMPTRYIRNVLGMSVLRQAIGLGRELEAELRRRGERA